MAVARGQNVLAVATFLEVCSKLIVSINSAAKKSSEEETARAATILCTFIPRSCARRRVSKRSDDFARSIQALDRSQKKRHLHAYKE